MRSKLSYFYNRDDMLDIKNKLLNFNPYYMVNEYIKGFDIDNLNSNYLTNLGDLNIVKKNNKRYSCLYDNDTNTIYSNSFVGDILGLFHVSSNDREKQGYGVVDKKNNGIGLNNGITGLFTNILTNSELMYPIESLTAEALLLINDKILSYAYFNNDKDSLNLYHENIPIIVKSVDNISKDLRYLSSFNSLSIPLEFKSRGYIFNSHYKSKLNTLNNEVHDLYRKLVTNLYTLLNNLIIMILDSKLEDNRKKEILEILNEDLNSVITMNKSIDLSRFDNYIKEFSSVKRKMLCKR